MPAEIWAILTNAGPVAGIMGFMWWLERKQRVEYQTKYEKLLIKEAFQQVLHVQLYLSMYD